MEWNAGPEPLEPPPIIETSDPPPAFVAPEPPPKLPKAPQTGWQKAWGTFVAALAVLWKWIYPIFKLAKGGKILLTASTMLLSVWVYSHWYGWWFALGFVVCIFIHEMGHVFAAWRLGMPVTAPIFIPGMGALILSKGMQGSAYEEALMGYGGPLFGSLAAVGCWGIYGLTGHPLFLGLALLGFFINLFNMLPVFPLDGGWITGAVSPYIWVVGMIGLVALFVTGHVHNPFIWMLIIFSLPRVVTAFKTGSMDAPGKSTTPKQRLGMGLAYIALCVFLAWGVVRTHEGTVAIRQARMAQTVQ